MTPPPVSIASELSPEWNYLSNASYFNVFICPRFLPLVKRTVYRYFFKELTLKGALLTISQYFCPFSNPSSLIFRVDLRRNEPQFKLKPEGLKKTGKMPSIMLNKRPRYREEIAQSNVSILQQASSTASNRPPCAYSGSMLHVNRLLNRDFGYAQRRTPAHAPLMVNRQAFSEVYQRYRDQWIATAKRRFRSSEDMQFQFAYTYYVMSMKVHQDFDQVKVISKLFNEEIDRDKNGRLDYGELRILILRSQGPSQAGNSQSWRRLGEAMVRDGCFDTLQNFIDALDPQGRGIDFKMVRTCMPMRNLFDLLARNTFKYKSIAELADDETVIFKMLENDKNEAVDVWLMQIRRKPPTFFCINDDLDHNTNSSTEILEKFQQFLHEFYPLKSQFEMEPGLRNRFGSIYEYREFVKAQQQRQTITLVLTIVIAFALVVIVFYYR